MMSFDKFPKEKIEKLFHENYGCLTEGDILDINRKDPSGDISNVVVGLRTHCYGIWLIEDEADVSYLLFYINGQKNLKAIFYNYR